MIALSAYSSLDAEIAFLLEQQKEQFLLLQYHWRTPLTPDIWYNSQTSEAINLANKHCGISEQGPIHWVHVNLQHASEYDGLDECAAGDNKDACILYDTFEVLFDHNHDEHDYDHDHDNVLDLDYNHGDDDDVVGILLATCDTASAPSPAPSSTPARQPMLEQQIQILYSNPVSTILKTSRPLCSHKPTVHYSR